jgi:hypothetical protein
MAYPMPPKNPPKFLENCMTKKAESRKHDARP